LTRINGRACRVLDPITKTPLSDAVPLRIVLLGQEDRLAVRLGVGIGVSDLTERSRLLRVFRRPMMSGAASMVVARRPALVQPSVASLTLLDRPRVLVNQPTLRANRPTPAVFESHASSNKAVGSSGVEVSRTTYAAESVA
jgi:hypothetical protein